MKIFKYFHLSLLTICWLSGGSECAEIEPELPVAADRIRNEPESVWIEFIQLALDYKPLNLGQGFPDFAAPQYLLDSLANATKFEELGRVYNNQYTRSFGHPRLVKSLLKYYKEFRAFDRLSNANNEVLITVGAYEALFASIMAFVSPGDEVIIIDPAFDAYAPMVQMAQGKCVYIALKLNSSSSNSNASFLSSADFQLDMAEFEAKITNKTKVLILNTPNNPLGKMYSHLELEAISNLCKKHNILVVADEVYEQMWYSDGGRFLPATEPGEARNNNNDYGASNNASSAQKRREGPTAGVGGEIFEHLSIARMPGMWDRTITIGSAGKTFSVTGWKIGWALGPEHLIKYLQLIHQTSVYTVATPLQEAIARAFEHEMTLIGEGNLNNYWHELRADLLDKRNRMARILAKANMRPIIPQGGYFMLTDFSPLAQKFKEQYLREEGAENATGRARREATLANGLLEAGRGGESRPPALVSNNSGPFNLATFDGEKSSPSPAEKTLVSPPKAPLIGSPNSGAENLVKFGKPNTNDYKFVRWLSKSKKLQGIPGSAFYSRTNKHLAENLVRFCFIKRESTLNFLEMLIEDWTRERAIGEA